MFQVVSTKPKRLKMIFKILAHIQVPSLQFIADEKGVVVNALDNLHTTHTYLKLEPLFFLDYLCDEIVRFSLDMEEVMKIINRAHNDDRIIITLENNGLRFSFINEKSFREESPAPRRRFRVKLIDEDYDTPNTPILEYSSEIMMPSQTLRDIVQDTCVFTHDIIRLTCTNKCFYAEAEGLYGSISHKYDHNPSPDEENDGVVGLFSVDKLELISEGYNFSDKVLVSLGENIPGRFIYNQVNACLIFTLAPRGMVK